MDKKWIIMDEKWTLMNGFHLWTMDYATWNIIWNILFYDRLIPIFIIYVLSNWYLGWLLDVTCKNIG
jgi:hypothetical protein